MKPTNEEEARQVATAMIRSVGMIRMSMQVIATHVRSMTDAISGLSAVLEAHADDCKKCGDCDELGTILATIPRGQVDESGQAISTETESAAEAPEEEEDPRYARMCIVCRARFGAHRGIDHSCPRPGRPGEWFEDQKFTAASAAER